MYQKNPFIPFIISIFILLTTQNPSAEKKSYYWYDGTTKRPITLETERWVEFSRAKTTDLTTQSNQSNKHTLLEKNYGNAQLYNRNKALTSKNAHALSLQKEAQQHNENYSPIFKDAGEIKALPGGVIISFKSDWDEQMISQWATQHHLTIVQPLIKSINLWLIHSESGMASLELANKLTEQGEINYASPNWWRPASTR